MHVRWVSVRWSILYTDRIHLHLWILPLCYRHNEKQVDRNKSPSDIDGGSLFFTFLMTIKTGMFSDDTSVIGFSIPASFTDLLIRWISAVPAWRRGKNTVQPRKHRTSNVHSGSNPQCFFVLKRTQTYYCCFFMAQIMETMWLFFFPYDYVLVCHASSLQYSFYISLYYTEQQSNSENRAGSCASRHSARLTSTAGFTVSEYIQKDYYCRYHTK